MGLSYHELAALGCLEGDWGVVSIMMMTGRRGAQCVEQMRLNLASVTASLSTRACPSSREGEAHYR